MITDISQLDPKGYYTYQDYLSWRFQERVELLLGRIFKMSPAPSMRHQQISRNLTVELHSQLKVKGAQVFAAPFDVRLPVSKQQGTADTVVQPDLCVICDPEKIDARGCKEAPDLVVEILSPGNLRKERKEKFELYEASQVKEYCIVDPQRDDILVYHLNEQQKYIGSKPFVTGENVSSVLWPDLLLPVNAAFSA